MAPQKLIAVKEFCSHHSISIEFVRELHKNELIELVTIKKRGYIPTKHLHDLEKMVRLYRELNINIEGIQTILHLLSRLESREQEIRKLRNRLSFYLSSDD